MAVTQITKRDGSIVAFNQAKIWKAISKAFLDVKQNFTAEEAKQVDGVTESVMQLLDEQFVDNYPTVEIVQDIVEKKLMERGFYDVAKGYILYRKAHEDARKEEQAKLEGVHPTLKVRKSSGEIVAFNRYNITKTLSYYSNGLENDIDIDLIVTGVESSIYDGMTTKEISQIMIMTVRSYIDRDPAYSVLAARLLLNTIYENVIGNDLDYTNLDTLYRQAFVTNINSAVESGLLSSDMLDYNLEWLSSKIKPERDGLFKFLGIQTLYDRYFIKDPLSKRMFDTPQGFWMRVAMGLALVEKPEVREQKAVDFYEIMSQMYFVPSTPTLFHAGTNHPQLSSCYLNTIEDDLGHIFKVIGDNAQMSKWSGGIGTDFTNLRGIGALIKGTGVESQGIVPFLKVANDTTAAINRSGKRRGAAVVYLETWHIDIEDFLELRKNTGDERRRTHDMNTANWIPDLFMERVRQDGDWTLFSPDETPDLHHIYGQEFNRAYRRYEQLADEGKIRLFRRMKAKDLWRKMITMLYETGHPWITFKDPSNIRSPQDHVGVVHNSNLCTEITLNNSAEETAVCNLGSLNLKYFVKNGAFDKDLVSRVVPIAIRMLDNVVDINFYPTKEGEVSNKRHRPIGLGIMGYHDALYQLDINFDSEGAVEFADYSMEMISYYAILASSQLAQEKGAYETFKGSKWDRGILPVDTISLLEQAREMQIPVNRTERLDWSVVRESIKKYGMRNSNTMAIAPTSNLANITDAVPANEPIYKNLYVKSNQAGDFTVINSYLIEDLKKIGLWNSTIAEKIKYFDGSIAQITEIPSNLREKYKEVFEIDPKWLVKAAAYRGKWMDQSQSLNIFYKGVSGKEIADVYMYAWEMGVKTTYYLRTLAISQVEKATVSVNEFGTTHRRDFASNTTNTSSDNSLNSIVSMQQSIETKLENTTASVTENLPPQPPKSNIFAVIEGQICDSCQ
ncbi:MAG: Ribonucleoside-diphosphate reductase 1 subunit alpha [Candidatus Parcubacteria bacterium]|jgi:ribonucleoside-diphosphate reductase alpha chain